MPRGVGRCASQPSTEACDTPKVFRMRTNDHVAVHEDIAVPLDGGGTIAGTLWLPAAAEPIATVVIHPATAAPERLYAGFAGYLAEHRLAAVTYDYRGTGRSGSPRDHRDLRMRDWMGTDVPAVAQWACMRQPGVPQLAVGHSIGGHALALANGTEGLAGFVMIASHAGTTRAIPDRVERARARLILSILGPTLARLVGYVPGRRLGLGEDMPGGPMLEWGRWSRRPRYFFDDPSMQAEARAAAVTQPVLAIGFADDPWATPRQIDVITDHLVNALVERRTYSPADGGVSSIGHMGFFRRGVRDTLWPEVLSWLNDRAERAAR